MKILIGMETSGKLRNAFLLAGHDCISCDLLPADDWSPYHHQGDIYGILNTDHYFDLIICHPTCTKMTVSGNWVYAAGKPRHHERVEAVRWTEELWNVCKTKADRVCFENPMGVLTTMSNLPKPQYVQPYQFGDDASKKTALFLHNLPPLIIDPAQRFPGRMVTDANTGKQYECWSNQTDSRQNRLGPSADRWKLRSETYPGLAAAIVEQWGALPLIRPLFN